MDPRYEANFERALHRGQAELENKTEETEDDLTCLDKEEEREDN